MIHITTRGASIFPGDTPSLDARLPRGKEERSTMRRVHSHHPPHTTVVQQGRLYVCWQPSTQHPWARSSTRSTACGGRGGGGSSGSPRAAALAPAPAPSAREWHMTIQMAQVDRRMQWRTARQADTHGRGMPASAGAGSTTRSSSSRPRPRPAWTTSSAGSTGWRAGWTRSSSTSLGGRPDRRRPGLWPWRGTPRGSAASTC